MKLILFNFFVSLFFFGFAYASSAEHKVKANVDEYVISTFDSSGNLIEQLAPSQNRPRSEKRDKTRTRGISSDQSSGSALCKSKGYTGASRSDSKTGTTVCYKVVKSQNSAAHVEQEPVADSEDEFLLPAAGLMQKSSN